MDTAINLSPLGAADVEVLAPWAEDELFCADAGWIASRSTVRDFCAHQSKHPPKSLTRLGARIDAGLVGRVDRCGDGEQERELGYLIGLSHRWGNGLGVASRYLKFRITRTTWAQLNEAGRRRRKAPCASTEENAVLHPQIIREKAPHALRRILESLPNWRGDPEAVDKYVETAAPSDFGSVLCVQSGDVAGVALTPRHLPESAELQVIGVSPHAQTRAYYRAAGILPTEQHPNLDWPGPRLNLERHLRAETVR